MHDFEEGGFSWFVCVVLCLCRDPGDCSSLVLVFFLMHWPSNCGLGWAAMVTKRSEGVRGSGQRTYGESVGSVHSVPKPMCGRGGGASDATATSQQCCRENTGRWLRRELAKGPRALLRRVERRTRSPRVRRQRSKSFGRRLSGFEDKEERQDKMDRVMRSEGKVVLKKTGAWKWRMRSRAERSWTSRGKGCRGSCGRSKDSPMCRRTFKAASKKNVSAVAGS